MSFPLQGVVSNYYSLSFRPEYVFYSKDHSSSFSIFFLSFLPLFFNDSTLVFGSTGLSSRVDLISLTYESKALASFVEEVIINNEEVSSHIAITNKQVIKVLEHFRQVFCQEILNVD